MQKKFVPPTISPIQKPKIKESFPEKARMFFFNLKRKYPVLRALKPRHVIMIVVLTLTVVGLASAMIVSQLSQDIRQQASSITYNIKDACNVTAGYPKQVCNDKGQLLECRNTSYVQVDTCDNETSDDSNLADSRIGRNQPCNNTSQCQDGLACIRTPYGPHCLDENTAGCGNGRCEENIGESSATCPQDCSTPVIYEEDLPIGYPCTSTAECAQGLACSAGICKELVAGKNPEDTQCAQTTNYNQRVSDCAALDQTRYIWSNAICGCIERESTEGQSAERQETRTTGFCAVNTGGSCQVRTTLQSECPGSFNQSSREKALEACNALGGYSTPQADETSSQEFRQGYCAIQDLNNPQNCSIVTVAGDSLVTQDNCGSPYFVEYTEGTTEDVLNDCQAAGSANNSTVQVQNDPLGYCAIETANLGDQGVRCSQAFNGAARPQSECSGSFVEITEPDASAALAVTRCESGNPEPNNEVNLTIDTSQPATGLGYCARPDTSGLDVCYETNNSAPVQEGSCNGFYVDIAQGTMQTAMELCQASFSESEAEIEEKETQNNKTQAKADPGDATGGEVVKDGTETETTTTPRAFCAIPLFNLVCSAQERQLSRNAAVQSEPISNDDAIDEGTSAVQENRNLGVRVIDGIFGIFDAIFRSNDSSSTTPESDSDYGKCALIYSGRCQVIDTSRINCRNNAGNSEARGLLPGIIRETTEEADNDCNAFNTSQRSSSPTYEGQAGLCLVNPGQFNCRLIRSQQTPCENVSGIPNPSSLQISENCPDIFSNSGWCAINANNPNTECIVLESGEYACSVDPNNQYFDTESEARQLCGD